MKKIILLLGALMMTFSLNAQVTDVASLDDVLYVEPMTADRGTQAVLSIQMKNSEDVSSFEFNLELPEGISFALDELGLPMAELSTERTTSAKTDYFNSAIQADGTLKVLCASTKDNPSTGKLFCFEGNEGEVARITIDVPADIEYGDYEVKVLNGKLTNPDGVKTTLPTSVVTTLTIADMTIVLDENNLEEIPTTETAVPVKVIRPFKADTWSTACFPFAMTAEQIEDIFGDAELKDFKKYVYEEDDEENITAIRVQFEDLDVSEGIEANYPFLVKPSAAIDEFTLTTVLEPDEESAIVEYTNGKTGSRKEVYGTLQGVYTPGTLVPENCLFISGNKFWYSTGATSMKPFRAYFDFVDLLSDVENAGANIDFIFDQTTGIKDSKIAIENAQPNTWYTLDGRKLNKKPAQKGVYIYNGQKQVIK